MTKLSLRVSPMLHDCVRVGVTSWVNGKPHPNGKLHIPKWMYAQLLECLKSQFEVEVK